MADDIVERLNAQHLSTAPTQTDKDFIWSLQKVITDLVPDLDEDSTSMPHFEQLSDKAETLLREIIQDLCAIQDANRSSACDVHKLQSISVQVSSNSAEAWALGIQVKSGISEAAGKLGLVGEEKLADIQRKLIEFHDEAIRLAKDEIKRKLHEHGKAQKRLRTKQVGYDNVDVPEGGGNIFLAIGSAFAKPFLKMYIHVRSEKLNEERQVTEAQEKAHKAELELVEKMERNVRNAAEEALDSWHFEWGRVQKEMWDTTTKAIERTEKQPVTHRTQEYMSLVLGKTLNFQLRFDVQMNEFLGEMSPNNSTKSAMTLEIEKFYDYTKNASVILTQLLSTKEIVRDHNGKTVATKVHELCRVLSEHLSKIRKVFVPWRLHLAQDTTEPISFTAEITALKREAVPFDRNVRALTGEIRTILSAETSKSKSKRAQEKQKEGDKLHGTSDWIERPLATVAEARDALQKVDDVTDAVWKLSNELGMGLMYYDNRHGQDPTSANVGEGNSKDLPTDPFLVSERTVAMVSSKLSSEIIRLDALAGSKPN